MTTLEKAKDLIGYHSPEFRIGDEVIFRNKAAAYDKLYKCVGVVDRPIPMLVDDEHFWHWDYDVVFYTKGLIKGIGCYHLEFTEWQKRARIIENITDENII